MLAFIILAYAVQLNANPELGQQRWVLISRESDSSIFLDKSSVRTGPNQRLWIRLILKKPREDGVKIVDYLEKFNCDTVSSRPDKIVGYSERGEMLEEVKATTDFMSIILPASLLAVQEAACNLRDR